MDTCIFLSFALLLCVFIIFFLVCLFDLSIVNTVEINQNNKEMGRLTTTTKSKKTYIFYTNACIKRDDFARLYIGSLTKPHPNV